MHVQILSSGSKGNCALVRAGDTNLLVDVGMSLRETHRRLELARVFPGNVDAVAITHGHLDHARSAGAFGRRHGARIICAETLMSHPSIRGAPKYATLPGLDELAIEGARGDDGLRLRAVTIPHDSPPTVALRLTHGDRRVVFLTDMGRPDREVAQVLTGAHVLVLEFNHDQDRLRNGPYPANLKRRVAGEKGHLSNREAQGMVRLLAGKELHTLVLAHLSETNNTPGLARESARSVLAELGRDDVRILVADQDEIGPNLAV